MRARLKAAGLSRGTARVAPDRQAPTAPTARVAAAQSRAEARHDRQRQLLRPLGWAFIVIVAGASVQSHPAPALHGARLAVTISLVVYCAAVAAAINNAWTRRGLAIQVVVIGLAGGLGVTLAVLQPHGPGQLAASMSVWLAAVRLPTALAAAGTTAITAALTAVISQTQRPAAQSAIAAALLCLLLAVTGQFIRRSRDSQDRTELLLAQLQDARDAEAAAAALAERGRIAGELHDVLAHSLSGLTIQLQGARKLADIEKVSHGLRAAIERSAQLAKEGLGDARQAVGALRGDRLLGLDQLGTLVDDFRRDTGISVSLAVSGTPEPLPAETSLALYRGAQEALTNIARYAPRAEVVVSVHHEQGRTFLTVENHERPADNGTAEPAIPAGPDGGSGAGALPLAGAGGGNGLAGMRERLQRAGGTARAGPVPGGWLVELEVPG